MSSSPRRLDQILSSFGYCSRRESRQWLKQGRVTTLDGTPLRDPSERHDPASVRVDKQPIPFPLGLLLLMHKPLGRVCSHSDREGATIYELLPEAWMARRPQPASIGRLDRDSSGLLLITDQGSLIQRWTSPRHKVAKIYEVTVDRPVQAADQLVALFGSGMLRLPGETTPCLPAPLELISEQHLRITLHEGRHRQIRRMFATQGLEVTALHRTHFGAYQLGELKPGDYRALSLPVLAEE